MNKETSEKDLTDDQEYAILQDALGPSRFTKHVWSNSGACIVFVALLAKLTNSETELGIDGAVIVGLCLSGFYALIVGVADKVRKRRLGHSSKL
jgi:hypothetical protein